MHHTLTYSTIYNKCVLEKEPQKHCYTKVIYFKDYWVILVLWVRTTADVYGQQTPVHGFNDATALFCKADTSD